MCVGREHWDDQDEIRWKQVEECLDLRRDTRPLRDTPDLFLLFLDLSSPSTNGARKEFTRRFFFSNSP